MAEAINPIATASNPRVEPRERVRHLKRGTEYEVLGEAELQIASVDMLNRPLRLSEGARLTVYRGSDGKLWARETDEFRDGRFETIASAPAPSDPAGAGGDLGELERLSKAATIGEATFEVVSFRIPECDDADLPGVLRIGSVEIAQLYERYGPGVDPKYEADGAYLAALWNAHRSGQLVASTPGQKGAGEEKTGACLTGYAEFTPISVRSSTGAPASPSGHSRAEPSGLGASPECPSRIPAYATDFDRISCMASRRDVEEIAQVLSTKHRGNEIYALAVIAVYRNGERVSDEHPQGEDPQGAESRSDASAVGEAETPAQTLPSPPSATPEGDPPMSVEEARELLDRETSGGRTPWAQIKWLKMLAAQYAATTTEQKAFLYRAACIEVALNALAPSESPSTKEASDA